MSLHEDAYNRANNRSQVHYSGIYGLNVFYIAVAVIIHKPSPLDQGDSVPTIKSYRKQSMITRVDWNQKHRDASHGAATP